MLSKFDYKRPATIEEALGYLETPGGNMIMSGGTDLLVQIRSKMCKPDVVVDITRIPELKRVQDASENIFIGGAVTFSEIMEDPIIDRYLPLLKQASMQFGSPLIRNLGTIAGNIQTASPAGDGLIALFTLMAEVVLISTKRERKIPITDFIVGPKKTSKEPNEIIKGFQISKKKYDFNRFFKIGKRNALAISIVNGGILQYFGIDFRFWKGNIGRQKVMGLFGNVNYFAEYLILPLSLTIGLILSKNKIFSKFFLLLALLAMSLTLFFTFTRGSYLAIAITIPVMLFLYFKSAKNEQGKKFYIKIVLLFLLLTIIALAIIYIPHPLNKKGTTLGKLRSRVTIEALTSGSSTLRRIAIWKCTWMMIKDYPYRVLV
jgi:hypothetical protein